MLKNIKFNEKCLFNDMNSFKDIITELYLNLVHSVVFFSEKNHI